MQTRRLIFVFLALAAFPALRARADSVSIESTVSGGAPTQYSDVKIVAADAGQISFTSSAGNTIRKPMASVVTFTLDDEPIFNQAQEDFVSNKFERAIYEYDQVISKTEKPWLKIYCMPRFTQAADKSGRFDKAVAGFINLVLHDPADAAKSRPTVPQPGSSLLDGAATALGSAADTTGIKPEQQRALLALLLEVDRARQNPQASEEIGKRLAAMPAPTGDPYADLIAAALADSKLAEARNAIAQKQFDQAAKLIEESKSLFVDSNRQAEALFLIARARDGNAGVKNDPAALRDAAIAYMRVVADFKGSPGAPHVAESLVATAGILEKLAEPGKAMEVYQSVVADFPGTPQANQARRQLQRLTGGG
jgi:TolA-binding protein